MTIEMIGEEDYPTWNGYLYQLQEEAPRPKPVLTNRPEAPVNRPSHFGDECHGLISREEGDALCRDEGNFLIRESLNERGRYTLVMRILGAVKNFKLYWEDGQFFVGDKRFNSISGLVEDGLITMYVEEKAHDYIQNMSKDKSMYSSLSKTKRLLTNQLPHHDEHVFATGGSPRRAVSVRLGRGDSPRHAHKGRTTECAALPYTHCQNGLNEYFDPSRLDQNVPVGEAGTEAFEDRHISAHGIANERSYVKTPSSHAVHCNHGQAVNLRKVRPGLSEDVTFRDETPYVDQHVTSGGGAKKSLTPTSSDERKRPKAKKIATEQAYAQQQEYYHGNAPFSNGGRMPRKGQLARSRSSNDAGSTQFESQPYRHVIPRPQLQIRPLQQSKSGGSPRHSPHRSPNTRRSNVDHGQAQHQYSLLSQRTLNDVAHARQLSGGMPASNCCTSLIPKVQAVFENTDSFFDKIVLDANDNQMVVSATGHPRYHGPNNRFEFDSSSGEAIPAQTFQQLRSFQERLEGDVDFRNEAQDEVTTLRGQLKPHPRLTRSQTTTSMSPAVRSHGGGKTPPASVSRDILCRQRSEPVESFHHKLAINPCALYRGRLPSHPDNVTYRQQPCVPRERQVYSASDQSELRAVSSESCDSSMSNVSESYFKPPDSISHLSSEGWTTEDRQSSPSSRSASQRSYSSDDNSLPEIHQRLRQKTASVVEDHPESRDRITALQPASPRLKGEKILKQNAGNQCKSGFVPPPEVLSAAKPRRKSSDPNESSRRIRSSSKPRQRSSETSSEEGTIPQPVPAHKPLQRRATTGSTSPTKSDPKTNGLPSLGKVSPSPKKAAQRSNSGPSPGKGTKSPKNAMLGHAQHLPHQRSLSPSGADAHYYDKDHVFKSHTYRGLQWCEYCGNFMWGIIQQGMQCRDCGLNVHKQCSKLVPGDCQPALKHVKAVFGIDLTALVKLHATERPIVVDKCIAEIEARGMDCDGIYRVSGFHDDVQQLKIAFNRYGNGVDMSAFEDINIVAGGLKLYLRELPVPLIPYNLYSRFINAAKLSFADGKLEAIRTALAVMPPAHLQTLKHIIHHLGRICDSDSCQMDAQNLGIVFGPTMLRPSEKSSSHRYNLNDAQYQKEIIQTVIENRRELFAMTKKDVSARETNKF